MIVSKQLPYNYFLEQVDHVIPDNHFFITSLDKNYTDLILKKVLDFTETCWS